MAACHPDMGRMGILSMLLMLLRDILLKPSSSHYGTRAAHLSMGGWRANVWVFGVIYYCLDRG